MDIQHDLDGKPKEFLFWDGLKNKRKPRILQDPNKEVTLGGIEYGP